MSEPKLTDEQARAVWRRAAHLQATAEQTVAARGQALAPVEHGDLSIEQVATAAKEAGIAPEFVNVVIAEQRLPDFDALRHEEWPARLLGLLMRDPHVLERERVIETDPEAVLAAFRTVATSHAYQLMPENTIGTDPLRDAVLVYRINTATSWSWYQTPAFASTLNFADARVLLVMVRPHERGTRVVVRVPLFRRRLNLGVTGVTAGAFGAGGGSLMGWAATSLGATALALAAPVAIGAIAGGAVAVAGIRHLTRSVRNSGEQQVDLLLRSVAVEAGASPA